MANYHVDLNHIPSIVELLDLAIELQCIQDVERSIKEHVTDDELGCSGNCEGVLGLRNPALKKIFEGLSELRTVVQNELSRGKRQFESKIGA